MPSFRYILKLTGAFLNRLKGVIILGIVAGVILAGLAKILGPSLWGKSNEKIGITGKYRADNLPNSILQLVSTGLTQTDVDGTVKEGIASSWETPNNGKTWFFHLKDNLYWQDGKKITSQSLKFNFSDVTIERPDEKTIIFKLQNPFSPFPVILSKPVFKKGFLGNGLWRVAKITLAGNYVEKMILVNKQKERITYKFYPTEERTKLALKLGEVDKLIEVINLNPFDSWKTLEIETNIDFGKYIGVIFNTEGKLTGEKSFRQALAYAIDKSKFEGPRALGPISPNSWAYNPQVKPYNLDQNRAKQLIKDLPKELKNELSIKLATTPILLSLAEKIAKDWEAVGVKTNVQVVSGVPNEYEALLAIFDIPKDPDQYAFWHSSQEASNLANYQSPRIDNFLENGRTETNQEARKKIYLDFQRFLVEDSPTIFLIHPTSYTIERK